MHIFTLTEINVASRLLMGELKVLFTPSGNKDQKKFSPSHSHLLSVNQPLTYQLSVYLSILGM